MLRILRRAAAAPERNAAAARHDEALAASSEALQKAHQAAAGAHQRALDSAISRGALGHHELRVEHLKEQDAHRAATKAHAVPRQRHRMVCDALVQLGLSL